MNEVEYVENDRMKTVLLKQLVHGDIRVLVCFHGHCQGSRARVVKLIWASQDNLNGFKGVFPRIYFRFLILDKAAVNISNKIPVQTASIIPT